MPCMLWQTPFMPAAKGEPAQKVFARLLTNKKTERIACLPSAARSATSTNMAVATSPASATNSSPAKGGSRHKRGPPPRPSAGKEMPAPAVTVRSGPEQGSKDRVTSGQSSSAFLYSAPVGGTCCRQAAARRASTYAALAPPASSVVPWMTAT